tara:strand:- start:2205 stop:2687 length:483 start_codon:yes stop_codon:yes gene_type:complete
MQIRCPSCKKNFEVDASLIPVQGRLLICGFCNYQWFYKEDKKSTERLSNQPVQIISNVDLPKETENIIKEAEEQIETVIDKKINQSNKTKKEIIIIDNNQNVVEKILSYTIVGIISFIALILIMDTFKSPLTATFPNLEYFLISLYETLKDIELFIIDLI